MEKQCIKCRKSLNISKFHKSKDLKGGYKTVCKECRSQEGTDFYIRHCEELKERARKNREAHPSRQKEYYKSNKKYFEAYRKTHANHYKQWRIDNRKRTNAYHVAKRKVDANFKTLCTLRTRTWSALKGKTKSRKTIELLGCSIEQFRQYLENKFQPGMSWKNHGKWHLDHIRPCISYNLADPEEQKKCFHFSNFQPLWAKDNLVKNKYY